MNLDNAVRNLEKTIKDHLLNEVHSVLTIAEAPVSAMILAVLAIDSVSQYYSGRERIKHHGHKYFEPRLSKCISEYCGRYLKEYQCVLPKIRNSLIHSYALPVGIVLVENRSEHNVDEGKIFVKKFIKDVSNSIKDYFANLKHDKKLIDKFYRHYNSAHLISFNKCVQLDPSEAERSFYFV